ncbi:hypothetical protein Tco_0185444 [Tanacetum coccineum]
MTKAQDQISQSMKEQAYNKIKQEKDQNKDSRTKRQSNLNKSNEVASDDLRDALFVIYLIFAHSRRSVSIRCQGYIGDFVLGCHAKDMVALYSVMSDSDESGVTYTEVSSPFEGLSNIGSPRADDHEYLELPWMPEDPYAPPSPDYVPGPEHADDEIVAEDQPYAEDASPTAQSPDYVPEFDPEADPEEDDDEDPEEDPVDYPADEGDNGDDEEGSSEDVEDDDIDIEADDDEEEEEHPAPADFIVVALPSTDQAPSAEETEPFKTDESTATPPPHPAYRMTVGFLFQLQYLHQYGLMQSWAAIYFLFSTITTTFSYSPTPDQMLLHSGIPPPLPISVPTPSPPLLLPSASRREDRPKVTLPPRKRLRIALGPRYEIGESSSAAAARPARGLRADYGFVATMDKEIRRDPDRDVGYGITESWDEIVETLQGAPVSTDTELGRHMTAFETRVRQDTNEIYTRLDDEQSQRQLLAGRLNMLFRDRREHAYTHHLMETEARLSREA